MFQPVALVGVYVIDLPCLWWARTEESRWELLVGHGEASCFSACHAAGGSFYRLALPAFLESPLSVGGAEGRKRERCCYAADWACDSELLLVYFIDFPCLCHGPFHSLTGDWVARRRGNEKDAAGRAYDSECLSSFSRGWWVIL